MSKKMSPTGERMIFKDYPKDDQHRTLTVGQPLIDLISADIAERSLSRDNLPRTWCDTSTPRSARPRAPPPAAVGALTQAHARGVDVG